MRLLTFVATHRGDRVTAPGGIGGQCVDLANLYLADVLVKSPIRANAVDWQRAHIAGMTWTPNGPVNGPGAGAIVVWNATPAHGIGQFGHIAVALLADSMDLLTFDQDWPVGAPCSIVGHDYRGVAGWFAFSG